MPTYQTLFLSWLTLEYKPSYFSAVRCLPGKHFTPACRSLINLRLMLWELQSRQLFINTHKLFFFFAAQSSVFVISYALQPHNSFILAIMGLWDCQHIIFLYTSIIMRYKQFILSIMAMWYCQQRDKILADWSGERKGAEVLGGYKPRLWLVVSHIIESPRTS